MQTWEWTGKGCDLTQLLDIPTMTLIVILSVISYKIFFMEDPSANNVSYLGSR